MLGAETRSHRRRRHRVSETSVAVVFLKVSETQTESRQTVQDEAGLRETVLLTGENLKYERTPGRRKKTKFS